MAPEARPSVKLLALAALVALTLGGAALSVFTVAADQVAVVTQFGNPVRVVTTPGLHLKYPYPAQSVTAFDRRLFVLVPPPSEFLTLGKRNVVASGVIVWRIKDARRFMQTVFDRSGAESRLSDVLFAELGAALGRAPLGAFVSVVPGEYRAEAILAEAYKISQKAKGEGEARAARIYADSLNRAPGFYRFVRGSEAVKKSIDKETTLVLPVDADLFRLLLDSRFRFPEE